MRSVLPVERVVGIGDVVDGRVGMLSGDRLESGAGLVAEAYPSGRPEAMGNGSVQRSAERVVHIVCLTRHNSTLRSKTPVIRAAANI